MKPRVTLREIARKSGVHFATVSRALRGVRQVNAETERRVRRVARELGYVSDPMLAALCRYRDASQHATHGIIGYLSTYPLRTLAYAHRQIYAAAATRAERLGFRLEFFEFTNTPAAARRLDRVLFNRSVQGLILPPVAGTQSVTGLDWNRFAAVAIGYSIVSPTLDRIVPDQPQVLELHLRALRAHGFRRIGMIMTETHSVRTRHMYLGTFLRDQWEHPGRNRVPPLVTENLSAARLLAWCRRYRPDVVATSEPGVYEILQRQGIAIPRDLGFSVLSFRRELPHMAAVDENWPELGRQAVDQVVGQITRFEFGLPRSPRITLVGGGVWRPGETLGPVRRLTAA